ncbi:hypothetical protein GZH47_19405 [Paenibacillus rhizovicinus]|uniref:VCBS repeat-containing protein n=1 Tax=Paenibacillus rhizovicinus TaxID=2704463 RepID=A0A6C0P2H6_9BACL|nr:hypothetical protein [Paenibacillus rhizovicinus]QHW32760.1 hypothetical protein GZH47_19405 [Paenibacillus rhizovicinus]
MAVAAKWKVSKMLSVLLVSSALAAACANTDSDHAGAQPQASTKNEVTANARNEAANAAEVVLADKPREAEEKETLSLLASIPDKQIYLYAKEPEGVRLKAGEREADYDWLYATPRAIPPVLQTGDYDGDGHEELAMILNVGSGTGVSLYELHMAEFEEGVDSPLATKTYESADYLSGLNQEVKFSAHEREGKRVGEISVNGTISEITMESFKNAEFGNVNERLAIGSIVNFEASADGLHASFGVGLLFEKAVTPQYVGSIEADVAYKGDGFQLTNLRFEAIAEYKGRAE